MLHEVATTARRFLLPHWHRWHQAWGPPAPMLLSQWTCVRSSMLLARALQRHGVTARVRSGRPLQVPPHDARDQCGLLAADGWVSHAWVEAEACLIDITADQFGYAPVVITSADNPIYRPALDARHQIVPTSAASKAIDEIWSCWCSFENQQPPLAWSNPGAPSD